MIQKNCFYGTGRRKSSSARVFIKDGTGNILINNKKLIEYFDRSSDIEIIKQPLELCSVINIFDIYITVKGGGRTGQSGAIRHGISRALIKYDNNFRINLRNKGFVTRDSRIVERKKIGLKKARRRPQYSKR